MLDNYIKKYFNNKLRYKYGICEYLSEAFANVFYDDNKKYSIIDAIKAHNNGFIVEYWNLTKEDKKT